MKSLSSVLICILFITLSGAHAQPIRTLNGPQPCGEAPLPPCDPGPPVPISGIELLLGAGALLGTKKYLEIKKKKLSTQPKI